MNKTNRAFWICLKNHLRLTKTLQQMKIITIKALRVKNLIMKIFMYQWKCFDGAEVSESVRVYILHLFRTVMEKRNLVCTVMID